MGKSTGYNPNVHHRRSIRLSGYDYSEAGAYFVTICVHYHQCFFGEIIDGEMRLNCAGQIVADEWTNAAAAYSGIVLDDWVVMPNHFHGIVVLTDSVGAIHELPCHAQRRNMVLPKFVGRFKMLSAKRVNELRGMQGERLWQRNYWEHVVRHETEWSHLRDYIHNNPTRWSQDRLHPDNAEKAK